MFFPCCKSIIKSFACMWAERRDNNSCNGSICSCRLHRCLKTELELNRNIHEAQRRTLDHVWLTSQREKEIRENQNNDIYMSMHTWIWTVFVCTFLFFYLLLFIYLLYIYLLFIMRALLNSSSSPAIDIQMASWRKVDGEAAEELARLFSLLQNGLWYANGRSPQGPQRPDACWDLPQVACALVYLQCSQKRQSRFILKIQLIFIILHNCDMNKNVKGTL